MSEAQPVFEAPGLRFGHAAAGATTDHPGRAAA